MNMDKFHKKSDRLFQVMEHRVQGDKINTFLSTYGLLGQALKEEMPEVEYAASCSWDQLVTLSVNDKDIKTKGRYAGKDFFRMFSYDLLQGNEAQVLTEKNTIVLSEDLAKKLFNSTESIIGRTIELDHWQQFQVSGVYKNIPDNASNKFDFVISYEKFLEGKTWLTYIGNTASQTYVLLNKGVSVDQFNKKIADYVKVKSNNEIKHRTMFVKPYADVYLYGTFENGIQSGGRISYVKLFSLIAIFILAIACINFMNLSTAKASRRIKEVGIKKAVGAGRRILIIQYLGESMFMSFLSLIVAVLMVDLLLPLFNEITAKHLTLTFNSSLVITSFLIAFVTGILAGSYPALYLSGFNTVSVLKEKLNTSLGERWARKGLVIFQFTLSVIFIVCVIVVYKQIQFVQSMNLGYSKDNIIYFMREGKLWDKESLKTFLAEINTIPGIASASSTTHDMAGHESGTYGLEWPGKDPDDKTEFENVAVNYDMIETLGVEMVAGRTFSPDFRADTAKIIFNEAAIKYMGLADPIGKTIRLWGYDMEIIGIVKDFHFQSLHVEVKPLFFRLNQQNTYLMMVKLEAGREKEAISNLQEFYKKFNPGFPLDYQFVNADYQSQYVAEQRVATLSKYFAGLTIVISCLGLFGLAAFTAERRLKEIGIRKVLGSTEFGIIFLLSADFTKIVFAAIVIALPSSFLIARYWLDSFAFKIDLQWWYFVGAGAMALFIAWLTVGTQAVKAARVNPTKCLKDE
jgi:predicted permease